jgi:tRNA-dihydrouridine synthase
MIGRGAFGNPWLFAQINEICNGEDVRPAPKVSERAETAMRQFRLAAGLKGEKIACLEARKHYAWYLRGVPHAGYFKEQIMKAVTLDDLQRITEGIRREL